MVLTSDFAVDVDGVVYASDKEVLKVGDDDYFSGISVFKEILPMDYPAYRYCQSDSISRVPSC
jgi:hypothetical protein